MWPLNTYLVIGIGFFCLVVYDILVAIFVGNYSTISKCMQVIGREWPIVVVLWGGLAAHFFFPKTQPCEGSESYNEWMPLVYLVLGFITFSLSWKQCVHQ